MTFPTSRKFEAAQMLTQTFEGARREISSAFEKVAFFHEHMKKAGLSPMDIRTPQDMTKIPVTRKDHYRTNFPDGVLAKGVSMDQPFLFRSQSSGSEGERLVTVSYGFNFAKRMLCCLEINPRFDFLSQGKYRTLRFAAPNCSDVECANPHTTMQDRILKDGTLVLSVYPDLLTTPEQMMDNTLEETERYNAHLLYADPTHLAFLIRHMRRRDKPPPNVKGIVGTYTMSTGVSRRQILNFFSKDVAFAEVGSMSEFGWISMECPKGNMHLNTKCYYLEFITDGRTTQPGDLGELVLTSLNDQVAPHIRYATGDLYRVAHESCPCGHDSPIVRMEGRASCMLVQGNNIIMTPREIDDLVGPAEWMDTYQLEQLRDEQFVFRYIPSEKDATDGEKDLKDQLLSALGGKGRLSIERTGYIPAERSGKFLNCKSSVAERLARREELSWK